MVEESVKNAKAGEWDPYIKEYTYQVEKPGARIYGSQGVHLAAESQETDPRIVL